MNKLLIVCLTYGFFLMEVGLIMAGAWFCEKLDPESDLASSIWDEILPLIARGRLRTAHPNLST